MPEPLVEAGLWVEIFEAPGSGAARPALFLDRDGTVIVDSGYPRSASDVVLVEEILPAIQAANAAAIPVVIVTNQSGVARGILTWHDFAAVNTRMLQLMAQHGCSVSAIIACAYHPSADPKLDFADHRMRKPSPGMLNLAAERLSLDLARSLIVGDRPSDLEAGRSAGLRQGFLLGAEPDASHFPRFEAASLETTHDWQALVDAIARLR